MSNMRRILTSALLLATALCALGRADDAVSKADRDAAERTFTLKVLPLFKAKCFACHGEDAKDVRADYDMRTREGILAGGESEAAAVVPLRPDDSPLYHAVLW